MLDEKKKFLVKLGMVITDFLDVGSLYTHYNSGKAINVLSPSAY
jgi:hypothetical protein